MYNVYIFLFDKFIRYHILYTLTPTYNILNSVIKHLSLYNRSQSEHKKGRNFRFPSFETQSMVPDRNPQT